MKTDKHVQLTLNFTNPAPFILRNLATLMEVADTAHGDVTPRPDGVAWDVGRAADPRMLELRKKVKRLVGCISIAHGKPWETVWVLAYHEFFKITGRHPVVESSRGGLGAHLDYIFKDETMGDAGILVDALEELLIGGGL